MTFLPIVERELRIAARKPSTYRRRTGYVLVTSLIAAGLLLIGDPGSAKQIGSSVFPALATLAFLYCLVAGARHAADSLSEEKREGTLGLLFLTDLRGYDIVLGKLTSVSARTVQGLFAFFPVLAIGLILGGITGGEFWRAAAILANALFFSLSLSLCISALSRASHLALGMSFAVLALLTVAPPAADWVLSQVWTRNPEILRFVSPAGAATFASDGAYATRPVRFVGGLLFNHALSWSFLIFASWVLPRSWQDRPRDKTDRIPDRSQSPSKLALAAQQRQSERRGRLEANPIFWLAARNERQRSLLWIVVLGLAVLALGAFLAGAGLGIGNLGVSTVASMLLNLTLKLWVAWHACATLAEAQRSGAMELLLATPLRIDEMIRGHWQALQRMFRWPIVVALVLILLPAAEALIQQPRTARGVFLIPLPALALFSMATFVLDLVAVAWVGMWMGLTQVKLVPAFAKTVVLTMVAPAVVFCFPNLLFDLFWISWARRKLEHGFRAAATEQFAPFREWAPPPVRAEPLALPPVIAR